MSLKRQFEVLKFPKEELFLKRKLRKNLDYCKKKDINKEQLPLLYGKHIL